MFGYVLVLLVAFKVESHSILLSNGEFNVKFGGCNKGRNQRAMGII